MTRGLHHPPAPPPCTTPLHHPPASALPGVLQGPPGGGAARPPAAVRVLVTGSRDWRDSSAVTVALAAVRADSGPLTVIHGACPSGADALADRWARTRGAAVERHPANWRPAGRYDARAGFRRNAEMVAAGADLVLAFIGPCRSSSCPRREVHGSHGATHCARLAARAGIPVIQIRTNGRKAASINGQQ